ncbi:MAG: endonuclease domain-containing protein [Actinomycetota bacterium]|nr:endonuclease domain-containing protein [Actinomycetota bacterium]
MQASHVPAALRGGPFSLAQARRIGIERQVLRGQRFRRVLSEVYVAASTPDTPLLRLDAALLVAPPGSFAVLASAAAVWRVVELGDPDPYLPHVGLPHGARRPRTSGVGWHAYCTLPALRTVGGRRTTAPVATFADLARRRRLRDAVTTGDALCRRGLVSPEGLIAAVDELSGTAGIRARRAARLVRPRVDSPMETLLRLLIVLSGLPEPQPNLTVCDTDQEPLARLDLSYPRSKVAIEYDGDHHLLRAQRVRDVDRAEWLRQHGWTVVVVLADHLLLRPAQVLQRVRTALAAAGATGLPDRLDDGWRRLDPAW